MMDFGLAGFYMVPPGDSTEVLERGRVHTDRATGSWPNTGSTGRVLGEQEEAATEYRDARLLEPFTGRTNVGR